MNVYLIHNVYYAVRFDVNQKSGAQYVCSAERRQILQIKGERGKAVQNTNLHQDTAHALIAMYAGKFQELHSM